MNNLWTPWRYKYITSPKGERCVLCQASESPNSKSTLVLFKGKYNIVLLNRYPYSNGHLMIAPISHENTPLKSPPEATIEQSVLLNKCLEILGAAYNPDGFNIGMNLGAAGGAGIDDHYHLHIVPRWIGDTNYMTTVSGTRLIPQTLEEIWELLNPHFEKLKL